MDVPWLADEIGTNTLSNRRMWHIDVNYSDVRGQESAKRALVIAAAGADNLLMLGPPGAGKSKDLPHHATVDPAAPLWVMSNSTHGSLEILPSGAGSEIEPRPSAE